MGFIMPMFRVGLVAVVCLVVLAFSSRHVAVVAMLCLVVLVFSSRHVAMVAVMCLVVLMFISRHHFLSLDGGRFGRRHYPLDMGGRMVHRDIMGVGATLQSTR